MESSNKGLLAHLRNGSNKGLDEWLFHIRSNRGPFGENLTANLVTYSGVYGLQRGCQDYVVAFCRSYGTVITYDE